jgi:hypothetical protein
MPMQLLERLCCAHLPMTLDAQEDIEKCAVLCTARLIDADMPPLRHVRGRTVYFGQVTVMRVTAKGEAASKTRARPPLNSPTCALSP